MAPIVLLERAEKKVLKRSFAIMSKSQKFAKGFSSSFIPDYRHAAEMMGESEGFDRSGRIYSEDSSAPKRKCISLNIDRGDCLNVPLEVISFAKIPSSERKELELRLRDQLKRIQSLQKKFLSKNVATMSSSSNGYGKKLDSIGSHLKRGSSGKFESTKRQPQPQSSGGNSHALIMKQCESILNKLRTNPFGWAFSSPVDAVALKIPDYCTVIKHPMDLGTIKNKLSSGAYSSPLGFVADVKLTFTNAMTYNPPGNEYHTMADKLSKFFESKWKPIEKKLSTTDLYVRRVTEAAANPISQPKKRKTSFVTSNIVPEKVIPRVSVEERQHLSNHLSSIAEDMPYAIVDLLRRNIKSTNEEEIEVDIDALSDDVLLELKKLLDDHLPEKQMGQNAKIEPTEMEILNESGLSNSLMQSCKGVGNEPVDEDVDIGGNDPPISSYPPVEIDKDTTNRGSECSSSSSSSGDSGSSSSDSDSGSSSGSESDDKAASPAKSAKVDVRPETVHGQVKSDIMDPLDTNRAINGLDQPEQDFCPNPLSSEGDTPQDGENAPSERQVSPEKLYRAALLRDRFADTILKAREKTLDQGEKGDHEKLRRDREEIERQQREEKTRLRAEARAAEDARKNVVAEAAAEAKRKRELEREAAREALLKIEKTVEINENSLILKDLELLGTVPVEHLPSSVDETSPLHSQDAMGGFKLGGSNPLEQLGLYMKEEDEEDEEAEQRTTVPSSTNDVEDGEID